MVTKVFTTTLISLLLITGAVYYFSSSKSILSDFHGNLTPTEHMLCKAQQFQQNDYTCIDKFRDVECQQHYYSFLRQYRENETKFYEIYERQPEDVKEVVNGWNKSCNTFEHYRRCGDAEYLFTHCVFSGQVSDCSVENREYIQAAWECSNVPDGIPFWNVDLYSANCMTGIVHLAKGSLAEALACK